MLPNNLAITVTDVFRYYQKKERLFVPARSFSAITLRYQTGGKYLCKGKTLAFEPVSVCIIPEGVAYERNNEEEEILVIHFNMLNYVFEEIQIFRVQDGEKFRRLFLEALRLKEDNSVGCMYKITAVVYEILAELFRDVGAGNNPKDDRILESAEYMRQNFGDVGLSVDAVANKMHVSPAFFRREFHRVYGTSPKVYLDTLRLQYAKTLLETGYFSQKEIAERCGFSDVGYFRTVFKRKTGKSMKQYLADSSRFDY